MGSELQIIFRDQHLAAINKPHGLLVHPSAMAKNAPQSAQQMLRNILGQWVYPVHRLDRKTAGVLLFALDKETNSMMQQQFMNGQVEKTYHAIVRGYCPESGIIDYPITNDKGIRQNAITNYKRIGTAELPVPQGNFQTSRYSLVEVKPVTGRMHQIRKHFAHIMHPIIGDRPYGCNKQNRLFKEKWNHTEMLLHASSLSFVHPYSGTSVHIEAPFHPAYDRILALMGWSSSPRSLKK